jgi:hypothetical protein
MQPFLKKLIIILLKEKQHKKLLIYFHLLTPSLIAHVILLLVHVTKHVAVMQIATPALKRCGRLRAGFAANKTLLE